MLLQHVDDFFRPQHSELNPAVPGLAGHVVDSRRRAAIPSLHPRLCHAEQSTIRTLMRLPRCTLPLISTLATAAAPARAQDAVDGFAARTFTGSNGGRHALSPVPAGSRRPTLTAPHRCVPARWQRPRHRQSEADFRRQHERHARLDDRRHAGPSSGIRPGAAAARRQRLGRSRLGTPHALCEPGARIADHTVKGVFDRPPFACT